MAHRIILFVGTKDNVQKIYDQCDDSSSEPKCEMAFGADYIDLDCYFPRQSSEEFTKKDSDLYQRLLDGNRWSYCFDVRDPENYGDYGWLNIKEQLEEEKGPNLLEKEKRNQQRIIEHIKTLPEDTKFFFAESHW